MGLKPENNIIKEIAEYFGVDFLGMTGTDESMTIILKDKEIIISDFKTKSVDKIIKEIIEVISNEKNN